MAAPKRNGTAPLDPNDPLDQASDALRDLRHADDWDEDTDNIVVNNHITMPSQPEIDPELAPKDEPTNEYAKDVSLLARLLPPEHRIYFFIAVVLVGGLLLALAQGWL